MPYDYPAPTTAQFASSVTELLPMLKSGSVLNSKSIAGYHARVISGYALERGLGSPITPPAVADFGPTHQAGPMSDAQAVELLDQFHTEEASPDVMAALPIPWLSLAVWAAQLMVRILL